MENFVIATNGDGRIEAFYIDESNTVMHTWQIEPNNKFIWSLPAVLSNGLPNVARVEATADVRGQIQVVAYVKEGKYFTCFQEQGVWSNWLEIEQQ